MSIGDNFPGESDVELPSGSSREKWELMERVVDLETKLAEREERDRIRELEIVALRHELELRFAYNESLEVALDEERNRNQITRLFEGERRRADGAEQLLAAERARISYKIVNPLVSPIGRLRRRLR
jgi:hypothetical protein